MDRWNPPLLWPGGRLEPIWRLNPQAHAAFLGIGRWAVALMGAVAGACGLTAWGLWMRARWGHRLVVAVLAVNLMHTRSFRSPGIEPG